MLKSSKASSALVRMLLARVPDTTQSKIEAKSGMTWSEVAATLELVANFDEIKAMLTSSDPVTAMYDLLSQSAAPRAMIMALRIARPRLGPHLKRQGLSWSDVVATASKIDGSP